jgi:hypothetical protein
VYRGQTSGKLRREREGGLAWLEGSLLPSGGMWQICKHHYYQQDTFHLIASWRAACLSLFLLRTHGLECKVRGTTVPHPAAPNNYLRRSLLSICSQSEREEVRKKREREEERKRGRKKKERRKEREEEKKKGRRERGKKNRRNLR